ncbi:MAG: lipid-binding SYLF domain-containing protein, partial [Alphaproteobacteria bacterium]
MRMASKICVLSLLSAGTLGAPALAQDNREGLEATVLLQQAANVVAQVKSDPAASGLLGEARGVYVVPDYAEGAVIVGGAGGNGVMLARDAAGGWGGPAFYDIATISAGAQIGFTSGPVVMLLMSDAAVDAFKSGDGFALDASADLAVMDFTAGTEASTRGDVVVWSNAEGIYAGLTAAASDISWDDEANTGYYGREVTPGEVVEGEAGGSAVAAGGPDPLTTALSE